MKQSAIVAPVFLVSFFIVSCGSESPENCTVIDNGDNTVTIFCPDGSNATINSGIDPFPGDGVLSGSFEIRDELDTFAISHYHTVLGNLFIEIDVDLPSLISVGESLSVNNSKVSNLKFINLEYVQGISIMNTKIITLKDVGNQNLTIDYIFINGNKLLSQCYAEEWGANTNASSSYIEDNGPCD